MCFVCLEQQYKYICPHCKSTDTGVCGNCYRNTLRCPFCKSVLHKKWLSQITFETIIELYKSLNMYKLQRESTYNIYDLGLHELQILINNVDSYIRHSFADLPQQSKHIVEIVRHKIRIRTGELSYTCKFPVPILINPYQKLSR